MPRIQILSKDVRNLIAAGEVVERPASVVKELVENSIDAGAGEIRIEVKEGGLREISVADDGEGMDEGDLRLSIERHATSKLAAAEDLQAIRTLGFRGEALPSIAQVSRMQIESKEKRQDLVGHLMRIEGGEIKEFCERGCPAGTKVTVSQLFYNVPARKKFARSAKTELGHIRDMVERLALANPDIRFLLVSDGGEVVNAFMVDDQRRRALEIFGSDLIKNTYVCNADAGEVRVYGLVGDPSVARDGAKGIYWFVNRRPIRDKSLNHAIGEAYRSLLPRGYGPFSLLFVDVPPDQVDVNVHPTKGEVRFLKGREIHDFVALAVKRSLAGSQISNAISGTPVLRYSGTQTQAPRLQTPEIEHPTPTAGYREGRFSTLRPIGQFHNNYILCEGPGGRLVIIDQHAAHERIGYEKLKSGYERSEIQGQRLLVPDVVEVPSRTVGYMEAALEELNKIGWEIEHFGGDNFCVKAVPAILGNIDLKRAVVSIAEDLAEYGRIDSVEERIDYLMKVSACHAQVRAGDRLETDEIRHLLRDMDQFNWPDRCPHGRPAVFEIGLDEVGKWFAR